MMRRAALLLALGSLFGLVAGTLLLAPRVAAAEEVPPELRAPAAKPSSAAKDLSRPLIEATKKVRPAVVKVVSWGRSYPGRRQLASGSGFIISKTGHVLTNRHVLQGQLEVQLEDGRKFDKIRTLGADSRSDVAVIQILDEPKGGWPVAALGDSDTLEVGELVIAIGSPFELASSVSYGVVSATGRSGVGRSMTEDFIQTDAALNPGNSGGPICDASARVAGIATAMIRGAQGLCFAVSAATAAFVIGEIVAHGRVRRAHLGIAAQTVALPRRAGRALGGADQAVRIGAVVPGGPAAAAGLREGDVLVALDGEPLAGSDALVRCLGRERIGRDCALTVLRGGRALTVRLRPAERG